MERVSLEGYGTINYFHFDWETVSERKSMLDLERFVLYPGVQLADDVRLLGEIEIEHGGTGITKEFDADAGEVEDELEAGGEVVLEQLNVTFDLRDDLRVRAGKLKLPMGLSSVNDEPAEYFTTTRSEMESAMIPTNWYEIGVQGEGSFGRVDVSAAIVNGLTSEGFGSDSWIASGQQEQFETAVAEAPAFMSRVDVRFGDENVVGLSGYIGDSADNRRTSPLRNNGKEVDALVSVIDAHAQVQEGPWTGRALVLYGHLENSDVVAANNDGTPVGSDALGYLVAGGVDVFSFIDGPDQRLDVFGRYEFYDTQWRTTGAVPDDAFWERSVFTGGLNWHVVEPVVVKAQYSRRVRGRERSVPGGDSGDTENTVSLGLGFEF